MLHGIRDMSEGCTDGCGGLTYLSRRKSRTIALSRSHDERLRRIATSLARLSHERR